MIPNHVLNNLGPGDRVAILVCSGELQFLVHRETDSAAVILAAAARHGADVLATHIHDKAAILEFVADREQDLGGEG